MPGDHLEHQRVVAHRAGHRADMVEEEGERRAAAAAHEVISGTAGIRYRNSCLARK